MSSFNKSANRSAQPFLSTAVQPNYGAAVQEWGQSIQAPRALNPNRLNYAALAVRKMLELSVIATMATVFYLAAHEDKKDHDSYKKMVASLFAWEFGPATLPLLFKSIGVNVVLDLIISSVQYAKAGHLSIAPKLELARPKLISQAFATAVIVGTVVASNMDKKLSFPLVNGLFFSSQAGNWSLAANKMRQQIAADGFIKGLTQNPAFTFEFFAFSAVLALGVAFFCFDKPPTYLAAAIGSGFAAGIALKKLFEHCSAGASSCRKYAKADEVDNSVVAGSEERMPSGGSGYSGVEPGVPATRLAPVVDYQAPSAPPSAVVISNPALQATTNQRVSSKVPVSAPKARFAQLAAASPFASQHAVAATRVAPASSSFDEEHGSVSSAGSHISSSRPSVGSDASLDLFPQPAQ